MQIASRVSMWSGARTPTAKDYAGFKDAAFFFDAIENAGLGVHADTLPIAYGAAQWRNIAPAATGYPYNTDLDVSGMTPTQNSIDFSSDSAWAGWGYTFNTGKISLANAETFLSSLFGSSATEYTAEIVFSYAATPTIGVRCVSGFNERSVYYAYSTTKRRLLRYGYQDVEGTNRIKYQYIGAADSTGTFTVAWQQSSTARRCRVWTNGVPSYDSGDEAQISFWRNMIALKRGNQIDTGIQSGRFFGLRILPTLLTEKEIIGNHMLDKARFGQT